MQNPTRQNDIETLTSTQSFTGLDSSMVTEQEDLDVGRRSRSWLYEPFFGPDGCHLKGPYGRVLLCAVSLDANNVLFPIAFAVVEVESKDSWSYFLEHLLEAIGDDRYIIMSDRQKGLTQVVIFPNSWHRHCMDGFRVKIMMRFYAKSITSWPQSVGPRIVKAINETIEDAKFCRVKLAGRNLYEVYDGFTRFPVDLVSHTCECKAWQISGLPCKHGPAAIIYTRAKVENFCDAYYSIEKYIRTYFGLVSPLPGLNTLEEIDLLPPPLRRLPGRPKKSRRREKDEAPPSDIRRKLSTIKCTNCGQLGHNHTTKGVVKELQLKPRKQNKEHLQVHHKLQLEGKYKNMLQYKQRQSHNVKPKEQKGENQASKAPPNPTTQESMTERSDAGGVANVF
ncbi:transposon protein, putative, Mutator sub-class [Senna tora]|uniref:Transposon protein, putative, Mutator sub-class n=1 Tax=Senna tora TaxID=362788 RepID=A0A834XEX3_9FABA|nr:transposon protein, putative, Mutator sub-class [Senna tora]